MFMVNGQGGLRPHVGLSTGLAYFNGALMLAPLLVAAPVLAPKLARRSSLKLPATAVLLMVSTALPLPPSVQALFGAFTERWDGKGVPGRVRGAQIEPVMRVVHVADDAEVHHRAGGVEAALTMLRSRRETEFDPNLVDLCCDRPDEIFGGLDAVDAWGSVIHGCASLDGTIPDAELTAVLRVFADYADLKSPWFLGYSRRVAELTAAAARTAGLSDDDAALAERAALVHRIGAIGVSTGIWNKPGPLTLAERERVRTVPYLTERVLCRQPRLCEIGAVAAASRWP